MKLDIDCVRDVLLEFEQLPLGIHTVHSFPRSVAKYGIDNVDYTIAKLTEAGYVSADVTRLTDGTYDFYGIFDITFPGHQFLEKIKDNKIWSKTKTVASAIGSKAFDVIAQIATAKISELIGMHFNA